MNLTLPARRAAAALSVAALVLSGAACSSSGGEKSDTTTATTAASGADAPTTTTTTTTTGGGPAIEVLQALLPNEDELPDGYQQVPADEDDGDDADDQFGPELDAACPDAALIRDFTEQEPVSDDAAKRSFETEFGQAIEVTIRQANDREIPVAELIDAYNGCDPIETDDDGVPMTVDFTASAHDLGDESFHMQMDLVIDYAGGTIEMTFHGFMFRRDGISVQVSAQSGVDESDFSSVPADEGEAGFIAADIYEAIAEL